MRVTVQRSMKKKKKQMWSFLFDFSMKEHRSFNVSVANPSRFRYLLWGDKKMIEQTQILPFATRCENLHQAKMEEKQARLERN